VVVPALCLSASHTVRRAYGWLREQETYWQWFREMVPKPPLAFWIILAVLVVAIMVGYTASTLQLTFGRLYWTGLSRDNSLLPSNTVYAILLGPEEQMVLGTERGVAFWSPPEATDLPDRWIVYHSGNSPLPHNSVRALAYEATGRLWFGTEQGLAAYDGTGWQIYRVRDLGLSADTADGEVVYALAAGSDGRLWVGTGSGAAVLTGQAWTPLTTATSGLVHDRVLSLAIEPGPSGDRVWFGTRGGLSRLESATSEWTSFDQDFDPAWGGVIELTLDSSGRLWAGTVGGGLGLWLGPAAEEAAMAGGTSAWRFYRTANSDLPFNTVTLVGEVRPGVLWVGTAQPAQAGGELAELDGQHWKIWTDRNSGFSRAEALALAQDADGRWWLGTRTSGVDIYTPPERGR
jgi:ligand-binding sensor domain-containing protein